MKLKFYFLILAMCWQFGAFAQSFLYEGITYDITSSNTAQVGNNTGVYLEAWIEGSVIYNGNTYTVTAIGNNAFSGNTSLVYLHIPTTITSIGDSAFSHCSAITTMGIPSSVTSIGNWAFQFCTGLTSLTINNSVTTIGQSAFQYCTKLTSVVIPNSVTSIGLDSFKGCTLLNTVTLPNSLNSIGDLSFADCPSLSSVICLRTTPLFLPALMFSGTTNQEYCRLYVADASIAAYENAGVWQNFYSVNGLTPVFSQRQPKCSGATLVPLPTNSGNWIAGSWSPALNNLATTTYTFTPSASPAFNTTTMTIEVLPAPSAPTVDAIQTFTTASTFGDLTPAPSATIKWYLTANSTLPQNSTNPIFSTTYYVAETSSNGCESVRTPVTVVLNLPADHLRFDGVDDFVDLGSTATLKPTTAITVEFNAYSNYWGGISNNATLIGNTQSGGWSISVSGSNLSAILARNGSYGTITKPLNQISGGWHHFALTYDHQYLKFYMDGNLIGTNDAGSAHNILYVANNSTIIGAESSGLAGSTDSGRYFDGKFDDVRIWNVARTQEQISNNRICELQGNESGLIAYYNFNQGINVASNTTVTSLINSVSGGINGTLQNFELTGSNSNWRSGSSIVTGVVVPNAPTAAAQSFCGSKTVADLIPAASATLKWYDTATAATALASTAAITTGTYYVSTSNDNGCESVRISVAVTVNFTTAPTASAQSFTTLKTVADLVPAPSTTIKWYDVAIDGTALSSATALVTGTYYVSATNAEGCESVRTSVAVTMNVPATHLRFDGVDDFVDLGNSATLKPTSAMTLEFMAYHANWSSITNEPTLIGNLSFGGYFVGVSGTNLNVRVRRNNYEELYGNVLKPLSEISAGWHHFAFTYGTGIISFYIDGVLVGTNDVGGNRSIIHNVGISTIVGGQATATAGVTEANKYFSGAIDDVRFWNVVRTQAQINSNRVCELQGNELGLLAYYNFNQGMHGGTNTTVTSLTNSVSGGTNGTLQNFALSGAPSNWMAGSPIVTGVVVPAAPTASAQSFCGSKTVANLIPVASATIKWYNTATNGTALENTTALATGTYYVSESNSNGCESARTAVVITANTIPTAPTASAQTFFTGKTVADLVPAPSTTIKWYDVVTDGTALASTTALATGTYYVSTTNASGCESTRTSVNVTVIQTFTATHLNFDGINDYVDLGSTANLKPTNAITVEFNAYSSNWSGISNNATLIGNTQSGGWAIGVSGTNLTAVVARNSAYATVTKPLSQISAGWHHFALTYDHQYLKFYMDGNLISTNNAGGGYNIVYNANNSTMIGGESSGNAGVAEAGRYFNGAIDDLRIWNVARTQADFIAFKNCELQGTETGLVAYYNFNQGTTGNNPTLTTLTDATTNANHGTLTNFALTYDVPSSNWASGSPITTGTVIQDSPTVISPVIYYQGATATTLNTVSNDSNLWWYTGATALNGSPFPPIPSTATLGSTSYWVAKKNTNGCYSGRTEIVVNVYAPTTGTHLNFDGNADHVVLPSSTDFNFTNQMTVEFWMNSNFTPQQWDALVTKGDNSWRIALTASGKINFAGNGAFGDVTSVATVTDGAWHHVAVTYNGSNAVIYIDGTLDKTITGTGILNTSTYQVALGANLQNTGRTYNGNMDEVRIWNIARTASQIAQSKNCELQGSETGLLAYYKFNQGSAGVYNAGITTLTDATGNGHNGTLTYFALTNAFYSNWLGGSPVTSGVSVPAAPSVSAQTYVLGETVADLVPAPSESIAYYSAATGGSPLAVDVEVTAGTYYVSAININGCESSRTSVAVTEIFAPVPFAVTGGGSTCADGAGAGIAIELSGSETGVTYQVQLASTNIGDAVAGTGEALSLGNFVTAGTYTVLATNTETELTTVMTGSAVVSTLNYNVVIEAEAVTCITESVTLAGSIEDLPSFSTLSWTASNGGVIDGATDELEVSVTSSGTYILTATVGECSFSQSVAVDLESFELDITTWNGIEWSNGEPHPGMKAIIDGSLVIEEQFIACELVITTNGSLTVNSGGGVGVVGKITNNATATDFVVENNSVLIQFKDVQNVGPVTVNVNSFPLYRQDYTLWSSPVENQNLRSFSLQTLFNRFKSYDTALGTNGDYVQEIVTAADVLTKEFEAANGYLIRMPNNWVEYVDEATPGVSYSGVFKGVPQNGTITVPLSTANAGMNLVGNPYPSPIIIPLFYSANPDVEQTIYYWRKRNGAAGTGYSTYNNMGFVSSQPGLSGVEDALDSEPYIGSGQGFFVKSTAATQLTFNNGMRNFESNGVFLRSATQEMHRFRLKLSNNTALVGQTLIGYTAATSAGVDNGFDSSYFNDSNTALTSLINGNEYIIQGVGLPFDVASSVALGFKTETAGAFSISLGAFDGFFAEGQNIYIKDNLTGLVHNVKESAYSFTANEGIANDRFEVVYQNTLETNNPDLDINKVKVYKEGQDILINAMTIEMQKVELYDIRGSLIQVLENVNATTATFSKLNIANQVVLVKITAIDNQVTTKKIVY
ncbi:LamG-like jellyroll fold domain-containing protein [Flavobacterium sp. SM2513]|uniref:LamG-like jellyroll fold domain-containing protein n=1 Tax=Flavobacterium sp. SM2513 TaxID=3424766 RepID=UPI003D800108